jgi:hypothetical protein
MDAPTFNEGWNQSLTKDMLVSLFCQGRKIAAKAGRPTSGQVRRKL